MSQFLKALVKWINFGANSIDTYLQKYFLSTVMKLILVAASTLSWGGKIFIQKLPNLC